MFRWAPIFAMLFCVLLRPAAAHAETRIFTAADLAAHPDLALAQSRISGIAERLRIPRDRDTPFVVTLGRGMGMEASIRLGDRSSRRIIISIGTLLAARSDDEIAAILAHELAHADTTVDSARGATPQTFEELVHSSFMNRVGESEADVRGMTERLIRAGYNPNAMTHVLETIRERYGDLPSQSHPAPSARRNVVAQVLKYMRSLGEAVPDDRPGSFQRTVIDAIAPRLRGDDFRRQLALRVRDEQWTALIQGLERASEGHTAYESTRKLIGLVESTTAALRHDAANVLGPRKIDIFYQEAQHVAMAHWLRRYPHSPGNSGPNEALAWYALTHWHTTVGKSLAQPLSESLSQLNGVNGALSLAPENMPRLRHADHRERRARLRKERAELRAQIDNMQGDFPDLDLSHPERYFAYSEEKLGEAHHAYKALLAPLAERHRQAESATRSRIEAILRDGDMGAHAGELESIFLATERATENYQERTRDSLQRWLVSREQRGLPVDSAELGDVYTLTRRLAGTHQGDHPSVRALRRIWAMRSMRVAPQTLSNMEKTPGPREIRALPLSLRPSGEMLTRYLGDRILMSFDGELHIGLSPADVLRILSMHIQRAP